MPILHEPTFDITLAQEALLQALACLGAVYQSLDPEYALSKALFDSGYKLLNHYVCCP